MEEVSLSDAAIVHELDRLVGTTLVAFSSGMRDRSLVGKIERSEESLSDEERGRLEVAYRAIKDVAESKGEPLACRWFIGANTGADDISPAEAIRAGAFDDVQVSVKRMCDREEMGK